VRNWRRPASVACASGDVWQVQVFILLSLGLCLGLRLACACG
jgi:hypothetical protein